MSAEETTGFTCQDIVRLQGNKSCEEGWQGGRGRGGMDGNNAEPGGKNGPCDVLRAVEPTGEGHEAGLMATLIHLLGSATSLHSHQAATVK